MSVLHHAPRLKYCLCVLQGGTGRESAHRVLHCDIEAISPRRSKMANVSADNLRRDSRRKCFIDTAAIAEEERIVGSRERREVRSGVRLRPIALGIPRVQRLLAVGDAAAEEGGADG